MALREFIKSDFPMCAEAEPGAPKLFETGCMELLM